MAGIGFALRKLARRDDLLGVLQGYAHSAFIASGPWMFTILALAGINLVARDVAPDSETMLFRVVIIYNFCFSVVLTGPLVLVATRYLADAIYLKQVDTAPGMLLANLGVAYVIAALTAGPFYLFFSDLPPAMAHAALVNFFLVCGIWVVSIFLSAANVFFRDVGNVFRHLLRLWFYLSPALYSADKIDSIAAKGGIISRIFNLNPWASMFESYRNLIYYKTGPEWTSLLGVLIVSFILLALATVFFKRTEPSFAKVL